LAMALKFQTGESENGPINLLFQRILFALAGDRIILTNRE